VPGAAYTDSVDELIGIGRAVLREKFMTAEIGLSGVNFAVAETGTLCLVENEGNGRMCTTVPDVHIAITGIEKVVEKLEHVPPLFALLTRSATGQAITTYFNMISGPRKPGEKDGPDASCTWCWSTMAARRPTATSNCVRRCNASAAARA
jgi:L-lactate dehydrogenase complex protein LldF